MAKKNGAPEAAPRPRARLMKRFTFPPRCDVREVVVRELDGSDDEHASILADKRADSAQKDSLTLMAQIEQREAMRLSLVEVDGEPVNQDGGIYDAMDSWSIRTLRFMQLAFSDVNGASGEEAEGFRKAAKVVTGAAEEGTTAPAAPRSIAAAGG